MSNLRRSKCSNHIDREAVARCLECGKHFCRECITEHDGRMTCAMCLSSLLDKKSSKKGIFGFIALLLSSCLSFFLVWVFFYKLAQFLAALPHEFH